MKINPFLRQIQKYERQLAHAIEEKRECHQELKREKSWNKFEEEYTWSISAYELNKASLGLGLSPIDNFDRRPSLSGSGLIKWVMDVFYRPIRYVKVIREMTDIYNSEHHQQLRVQK